MPVSMTAHGAARPAVSQGTALGAGGTGKGTAGTLRGATGAIKDLERRQKSRQTRASRDALDFHEGRKKAARGHKPEPPVSHPPRRHLSCLDTWNDLVGIDSSEAVGRM